MSTATVHQIHPTDPGVAFDAALARELRRPFALDDLQFKIQSKRKDGGSEIVCYVDARAVAARLNLLCPGQWHTRTRALPPEMRPTRINANGQVEYIKTSRTGQVTVDTSVHYECELVIRGCVFEGIGQGDDPKAASSDSLKRAAVRAGIGEMLYACKTPAMYPPAGQDPNTKEWQFHPGTIRIARFLEIDAAELALATENSKPVLSQTNRNALLAFYRVWLDKRGVAAFGQPLAHGPADTDDGLAIDDTPADGVSLSETEEGGTTDTNSATTNGRQTDPDAGSAVVVEFPAAAQQTTAGDEAAATQQEAQTASGQVSGGHVRQLPSATDQVVQQITAAAAKLGEVSANAVTLLGAVLLERPAAERGAFPITDEEAVADLIHHLDLVRHAGWSGARLEEVLERAFARDATPVERRQAFLTQLGLNPADPAA